MRFACHTIKPCAKCRNRVGIGFPAGGVVLGARSGCHTYFRLCYPPAFLAPFEEVPLVTRLKSCALLCALAARVSGCTVKSVAPLRLGRHVLFVILVLGLAGVPALAQSPRTALD